jgi:hypothetical protein
MGIHRGGAVAISLGKSGDEIIERTTGKGKD